MFKESCIFLLLLAFIGCFQTRRLEAKEHPIILLPGFGGSQLFASLKYVRKTPHYYCARNTWGHYILMWLRLDLLLPSSIGCFVDYMRLNYNPLTKKSNDRQGVSVKTKNWGDTSSIEYVTQLIKVKQVVYYADLVNHLVDNFGFERNVSVRGAPYDFRKSPRNDDDVVSRLKLLVEETYQLNNNKKVVLLGHSYGCLYILHFLHQQTTSWKEMFIESFVSTSGPFGGSGKGIRAVTSGDNLDIDIVKPNSFLPLSSSWPSSYLFLPREGVWSDREVVAMTDRRNYTVKDFKQFFHDSKNTIGSQLYENELNTIDYLRPPGVKVHCLYSLDQPTPDIIDWRNKKFPLETPDSVMGPGDGTVNARSLNICADWSKKQKEEVNVKIFHGVDHSSILKSETFINHIAEIVSK